MELPVMLVVTVLGWGGETVEEAVAVRVYMEDCPVGGKALFCSFAPAIEPS